MGVELVDRSTKPIKIRATGLALEDGVRDLVNRFYALRNRVHETRERVTFVAQHTLAISIFPALIREVKVQLPDPGYRVVPANYDQCEALFYNEADFLLCYQSPQRHFDFSHKTVHITSDKLHMVQSRRQIKDQRVHRRTGVETPRRGPVLGVERRRRSARNADPQ